LVGCLRLDREGRGPEQRAKDVKFRDGLAMPLLTLPPSSPFEFAVEVNGVTTPQLAIGPCVMVPGSAGRPLVGPSDAEVAWAEEAPNVGDWEKLPPRATCPAPPAPRMGALPTQDTV
jgi:hypothetical protein